MTAKTDELGLNYAANSEFEFRRFQYHTNKQSVDVDENQNFAMYNDITVSPSKNGFVLSTTMIVQSCEKPSL